MTGLGEQIMFWILGPISVLAALGLLFAKKAVHAAIAVALVMINLGIFYIAQEADFLGIIQIFVYTGAVMMLFLFVLMLVGVDSSDSLVETLKGQKVASLLLALGLGVMVFLAIGKVARATDEQEEWVKAHHAEPEEGLAPSGDPVEGVDVVEHGRQATRETTEAVHR